MAAITGESRPLSVGRPSGPRYAVRIIVGCVLVWLILNRIGHPNALWALISVIVVTEPEIPAALRAFHSRMVNTLVGCGVGLALLYLAGPEPWAVLLGITISIFVSAQWIKVPISWRIAPITVVIVMSPSVMGVSRSLGLSTAFERTSQVLIGSVVALFVTLATLGVERFLERRSLRKGATSAAREEK